MTIPDGIRAHKHSIQHREEVLASERCGCFNCGAIFSPSAIERWVDQWKEVGQTALCPECGIDSVIGSESGYPITNEFLSRMKSYWF